MPIYPKTSNCETVSRACAVKDAVGDFKDEFYFVLTLSLSKRAKRRLQKSLSGLKGGRFEGMNLYFVRFCPKTLRMLMRLVLSTKCVIKNFKKRN